MSKEILRTSDLLGALLAYYIMLKIYIIFSDLFEDFFSRSCEIRDFLILFISKLSAFNEMGRRRRRC